MKKIRIWLLKKFIGNTPIIMNVTITAKELVDITGAEPEGIFGKWYIVQMDEGVGEQ